MAEIGREGTEVRARIVYWGIEGSGKSTNVQVIHSKLRPDHRGELQTVPTRLDPSVSYHALPIELGRIGGVRTRIQIIAVPGAPEHAPTRKQLLDQVDGIVFVVDTQRDRIEENVASLEELRTALTSYGRDLEEIPLVIQYNKRDKSDPYALEELHRKLSMRGVAAFESVASSGTAVLQTLTTISKRVIRHRRVQSNDDGATPAIAEPIPAEPELPLGAAETAPPPGVSQILEEAVASSGDDAIHIEQGVDQTAAVDPAMLYDEDHPDAAAIEATAAETEALFEPSFRQVTVEMEAPTPLDLEPDSPATMGTIRIESVGQARQMGASTLRIPIVLSDEAGRSLSISLTVEIETEKTEGGG
jgi:signal recognition particle receptor subunit beta